MKTSKLVLTSVAIACGTAVHAGTQDDYSFGAQNGVFVMTNDAESNAVIAYERAPYGSLQNPQVYRTGGRGSGGTVDPLGSARHASDDVRVSRSTRHAPSTFARLDLADRHRGLGVAAGAVASVVYVLNTR
jgi:hypothetical protein